MAGAPDPLAETVLIHYGVKGMRWGFRRKADGTVVKTGRTAKGKKTSDDDVKKLSDKDLRERINRLNMEKQYKDLSGKNEAPLVNGRKMVSTILQNSGQTVGTAIVTAAAMYGVKKAMAAKFGTQVVSEMFPKKK